MSITAIDEIDRWSDVVETIPPSPSRNGSNGKSFDVRADLNQKVSLWSGDITKLQVDAIVNAANNHLRNGGGIARAIEVNAGPKMREACRDTPFVPTGTTVITNGFNLPAKKVLHTVGPMGDSGDNPQKLQSCYKTVLHMARIHKLRTIAICCISTGIYGYPQKSAAHVALRTVRSWLEEGDNRDYIDRIIFNTFLRDDTKIYRYLMTNVYFPGKALEKN